MSNLDDTVFRGESIKERIERETKEEMDAGRGVRTFDTSADRLLPSDQPLIRASTYPQGEEVRVEQQQSDVAEVGSRESRDLTAATYAGRPDSWTAKAIDDVSHTLLARGKSYTTVDEFENFETQAQFAGNEVWQVFRGMLGQKLTREKSIRIRIRELEAEMRESGALGASPDGWRSGTDEQLNELQKLHDQLIDSIRDICGYGLLWFGYTLREFNR